MKIEVNVTKRRFFMIFGTILLLVGIFTVYAFGTNNPSSFGHTLGEIEFTLNFSEERSIQDGASATYDIGSTSDYKFCALATSGWYYWDSGNRGRGGRGKCEVFINDTAGMWQMYLWTEQAFNGITCKAVCIKS